VERAQTLKHGNYPYTKYQDKEYEKDSRWYHALDLVEQVIDELEDLANSA